MIILDIPATITDERNEPSKSLAEKTRAALLDAPYPAHCKSVLIAFAELADERGWSQSEAAQKVKHGPRSKPLSGGALSQLLSGTYKASPEDLSKAIALTVDRERGRAFYTDGGFAKTRLYAAMLDIANLAVITQRIACIHGGLLCGKTSAAQALTHDFRAASVVYMVAPYADTYGAFIRRLARLRGIDLKGSLSDLRDKIISSLDASHLLIVDEFHQPVLSYASKQALRVMEFIREINDTSRCGILLVGSSEGYEVLCTQPQFHRLAASLHPLDICDDENDLRPLTDDDLAAIAGAFKLRPDKGRLAQCRDIAQDHTVARLFDLLRVASGIAEKEGHHLTWNDVDGSRGNVLKLAA